MLGSKNYAYSKDIIKQVFADSPSMRIPKHDNISNEVIIFLTSISCHENMSRTFAREGPSNYTQSMLYVSVTSDVMISSVRFASCVRNEAEMLFLWH